MANSQRDAVVRVEHISRTILLLRGQRAAIRTRSRLGYDDARR
ncbi:MAG TPA: hypothetical protein VFG91_05795 [Woeseiaceae bacterium]|nr:hypothetical protein [Woeseiaceae bacterium]